MKRKQYIDWLAATFGGYLYELCGATSTRVWRFLHLRQRQLHTLYDSSRKFEMTGSLSRKQLLALAALLFHR